jgi:hypothetical protein
VKACLCSYEKHTEVFKDKTEHYSYNLLSYGSGKNNMHRENVVSIYNQGSGKRAWGSYFVLNLN